MPFHFNADDEGPFNPKDLAKFLQNIQQNLIDQLKAQGIDPQDLIDQMMNNPGQGSIGFSINIGPDGNADFRKIDPSEMFNEESRGQNNGFEEPFMDIFFSEETGTYQIIAEVHGVDNEKMVHLKFHGNEFKLHAETGPFKYKVSRLLKHEVDPESVEYSLKNGVLEIQAVAK